MSADLLESDSVMQVEVKTAEIMLQMLPPGFSWPWCSRMMRLCEPRCQHVPQMFMLGIKMQPCGSHARKSRPGGSSLRVSADSRPFTVQCHYPGAAGGTANKHGSSSHLPLPPLRLISGVHVLKGSALLQPIAGPYRS